jgi:hypothetical protein
MATELPHVDPINGDVWLDGRSYTPDEARTIWREIAVAIIEASRWRYNQIGIIRAAADRLAHDSELPAEMDSTQANVWLSEGAKGHRAVADRTGELWVSSDAPVFRQHGPFLPLVPLTRGQLTEIESKDKRIAGGG